MSIQTEINRLKQNVSAAFTAIANKGGTIPTYKVSGNLAAAISSIPAGVTVQKKTGSCTGSSTGYVNVTVGFKPDIVIFPDFVYTNSSGSRICSCAVAYFTDRPTCDYSEVDCWGSDGKEYIFYPFQTTNGFYINNIYKYENGWVRVGGKTLNYIAVKYTE